MKPKTVAILTAPKLSPGGDVAGFGVLTKRIVVLLTVWAMALTGALASGVMLSGSASAAVKLDTTAPKPVTSLRATPADHSIALSWVNPKDLDFTGVTIRRALGAIAPKTVTAGTSVPVPASKTATSYTDTALTHKTQYSYAVFAHDGVPNYAGATKVTATTLADVTPPGPVTNLAISTTSIGSTFLSISWTNPTDPDLTGAMVRRLAGATAPTSITDGVLVRDFVDRADYFIDANLTAGTQYSYAVFAHDGVPNYAAGVNASGATTGIPPHAVLVTDSTRATVGLGVFFDPAGSYAAPGLTLKGGTLDYGDGNPVEIFTGDPATWVAFHPYTTPGPKTVTLTVTDSLNQTGTQVVTMNIFEPPTAALPATGAAQVGQAFTFPLTVTTPAGTAFVSWSLYGDWLAGGYGTAVPATLTHTFTEPGTYTFTLTATNDAQGEATSAPMVVTVLP